MGLGLLIAEESHYDTPHSVGPPWTGDRPVAETSTNTQLSQETDFRASGEIRTRNPSKRMAAYMPHLY